ncbi:uncharacterized protein LOC121872841 [Homarus americanus]|uniref:uncharacterized protein LOC121872841 n=1 Tax=Homarus americanus TaxID=6706 RepID=UPI001C4938A5|nr:uncharacterized protein LOC121872841 [Homarus americanus]
MSVFRQESLSEEVSRESASFTSVAGGGVALHFKTSTSSSSTQTSSETVVQRMVGAGVQTSGNGMGTTSGVGVPASVSSTESQPQSPHTYTVNTARTALESPPDWMPGSGVDPTVSDAVVQTFCTPPSHNETTSQPAPIKVY